MQRADLTSLKFPFQSKAPGTCRVLQLIPRLRLGGVERFALSLVERLNRDDLEIMVCATESDDHPWLAEFTRLTPNVILLERSCQPAEYPEYLARLIQSWQADVVMISHSMLAYHLLPYLRHHCPAVSFVDYGHIADQAWNNGGFARLSLEFQRYLDLTLVSSFALREWMLAEGAEPGKIEVCYLNTDQHTWSASRYDRQSERAKLGLSQATFVLLYPARLDLQKRPHKLVEILSAPRLRQRNVHCLVAGEGPEEPRLRQELQRTGLTDRVTLLGAVQPAAMPYLMAASDAVFLPSHDEGIALVLFEAMSMGLPVVAARVGGQAELVTPDTGYLIPRDNGENAAYVEALSQLIDSPALCSEMGRRARERIEEAFSVEQFSMKMRQLLELARERASRTPRPTDKDAERAAERARQYALAQRQVERGWTTLKPNQWRAYHLVYWIKWRVLRPTYFWGLAHGLHWLAPVGRRIARWVNATLRRAA